MVIKGKLITCKRQVKEFNGKSQKEMLYITLAEVNLSKDKLQELADAFKEAGKKFTPDWVKNFKGYVNLKTEFDLPCKDLEGKEHGSIEDWLTDEKFPWMGAEVKTSINLKEGAVYPKSLMFISEGQPYDPFSEFDNDDEG